MGTVLGGFVLTIEVVPTDVAVKTVVVVGSGEVVDDDVDDVSSGRVDSDRLVVVSRVDVVELVVDDGCELLVGGNEVGNPVEGGTVLVVVSGEVVVGHGSTILVVVSTIKDVVVSCIVVVETGTVSTTVVVVCTTTSLVVTLLVVGTTGSTVLPKSYCTPDHQASGFPQHTPARSRYQPGCNCM